MIGIVIVGGGRGERFGGDKVLFPIFGKPLLFYTIIPFLKIDEISTIIVAVREENMDKVRKILNSMDIKKRVEIVKGGERRRDSVLEGLKKLKKYPVDKVLIHDAVRPLVSYETIKRVISEIGKRNGCIPCIPLRETVKLVEKGKVVRTLDRKKIFTVQTPQGFPFPLILEKIEKFNEDLYDDSLAFERDGLMVKVVEGNIENIKVTYREDIHFVERLIDEHKSWYRI